MSKNTVKPGLARTRQRWRGEHRVDAFARHVAASDVDAIAALVGLSSEVDAVTRLAVAACATVPTYSWSEIADRFGITRQAGQIRYGDRPDRGAI
jgi:hypothetical protein